MGNFSRGRPLRTILTLLVMSFVLVTATTTEVKARNLDLSDEQISEAWNVALGDNTTAIFVGKLGDKNVGWVVECQNNPSLNYHLAWLMNNRPAALHRSPIEGKTRRFAGKEYPLWLVHPGSVRGRVSETLIAFARRDEVLADQIEAIWQRIRRLEERVDEYGERIAAIDGKPALPPLRSATPAAAPPATATPTPPAPAGPTGSITDPTPGTTLKPTGYIVAGKAGHLDAKMVRVMLGTDVLRDKLLVSSTDKSWRTRLSFKKPDGTYQLQVIELDGAGNAIPGAAYGHDIKIAK